MLTSLPSLPKLARPRNMLLNWGGAKNRAPAPTNYLQGVNQGGPFRTDNADMGFLARYLQQPAVTPAMRPGPTSDLYGLGDIFMKPPVWEADGPGFDRSRQTRNIVPDGPGFDQELYR